MKMARRIKGNNHSPELAEKLIETAKEAIYPGKAPEVRGMALGIIIDEIESLRNKIKKIEDKIEEIPSIMYSMLKCKAAYDAQRIFSQLEKEQLLI